MIQVSRLNGSELVINSDLIVTVESTPDTVITLSTDHKWVVRESVSEVIERVVSYKRRIYSLGNYTAHAGDLTARGAES